MGPKLEEFEVLSTIGSGSHGTVRKVRRRQDNQILVWKELNYGSMSESEKQGLVTEVNLLRELRHPNVVKFLHHVVERRTTTLYILMEYCPGGDLKRLITKCRQTSTFLEEGFIWRVLKQICEALKVCHSRDLCGGRIILHRDIKPANVFLDAEGDVKLGDFGLARTLNSEASFATTFVGTPYYMSPEVINGQEYNEKSDMWSLGCLIYELCALHPPFQATTHKQLAGKIREARYDRIPMQYSNELHEVIGLLLTYEDFLRPTALMVLHHSALESRTSTNAKDIDDDPLYHSLSPTVLLNSGNKDKKLSNTEHKSEVSDTKEHSFPSGEPFDSSVIDNIDTHNNGSYSLNKHDPAQSPLSTTYSIREKCVKSDEERVESDVKNLHKNASSKRESERFHKIEDSHMAPALENTIEKMCREAKEVRRVSSAINGDTYNDVIITESDLARPDCACGGMSMNKWRERVLALREAEAAVRERELDIKERERDVIHREHRVASMEREARQHLVRAQIYLRQSRQRQNAATSPHRPPSDLDTTMSADVEDDTVHTTAKLDPQRLENPFLKMRGLQPQPEKHVSFNDRAPKFKSNTLDNPRSRLKRGNIFGLADRNTDSKKDVKDQALKVEHRPPLKQVNANSLTTDHGAKPKASTPSSQERIDNAGMSTQQKKPTEAAKSMLVNKPSTALRERSKSSENVFRKSAESFRDKENAPLQVIGGKKVPEIKQTLKTGKTGSYTFERPLRRNGSGRKGQQHKGPVLQFYNVV